jgi:hypothetical protein
MAWMPVDQFLPSHPKTARFARELGWTPRYACGFLLELWGWAIDHQPDGHIERADRAALAQALRMSREELAKVTRALREVGWIDPAGTEQGRLHEWEDWGGKIVERRKADRARQERNRRRRAENEGVSRVTSNGQDVAAEAAQIASRLGSVTVDVTRDVTRDVRTQTRQDETRQEKNPPSPHDAAQQQGTTGARALTTDQLRASNEERADEILESATGPWRMALEGLRENAREQQRLNAFVTYYADTRLEVRGDTSYVVAPNAFARDWLRSKQLPTLQGAIGAITGTMGPDVRVVLEDELPIEETSK